MPEILSSSTLVRRFAYKKNGKEIILDDFNPLLSPEEILKFHSGQYPELTTASIEEPEIKGNDMTFNITTKVGTKG